MTAVSSAYCDRWRDGRAWVNRLHTDRRVQGRGVRPRVLKPEWQDEENGRDTGEFRGSRARPKHCERTVTGERQAAGRWMLCVTGWWRGKWSVGVRGEGKRTWPLLKPFGGNKMRIGFRQRPDDGGSTVLSYVDKLTPGYKVLQARRQQSS
jgi:hypothetical protein